MRGYWNRVEATAVAFTEDGYFRTGGIGVIDESGYVRICDRKKDMVLVSGFNVYPYEVEAVLNGLPGVVEFAVVGVPDTGTDEAVRASIVRDEVTLTDSTVLTYCRNELAAYTVPRQIVFVDSLPKSPVGKILRRELKNYPAVSRNKCNSGVNFNTLLFAVLNKSFCRCAPSECLAWTHVHFHHNRIKCHRFARKAGIVPEWATGGARITAICHWSISGSRRVHGDR
ncbi:AMP-binding enzyme [Paraburkholderia unamae]|uniref:AMP-binding enzyme n=1 Tax=Paraburkholderia unamae TaxID=219649 RepID=UPI000DC3D32A|nr:AMP-binding enzyme [Paraburkholderia unamae]